jgi:hypothetical protein
MRPCDAEIEGSFRLARFPQRDLGWVRLGKCAGPAFGYLSKRELSTSRQNDHGDENSG